MYYCNQELGNTQRERFPMKTSLMDMTNIIISGTYTMLMDQSFVSLSLSHQSFSGSKLTSNLFQDVVFEGCVFFSSSINSTNFIDCHFKNCNFSFARIEDCNFISCTFENCSFNITNSLNCNFMACTFNESPWTSGQVVDTKFTYCSMNELNENEFHLGA